MDLFSLDLLVVLRITDSFPVSNLNIDKLKIPHQLADPKFSVSGKIDTLLGAESFFHIVEDEEICIPNTNLVFLNTLFRYVETGSMESAIQTQYCGFISQLQSIDEYLEMFWQIETVDEPSKILSKEGEYCEEHYKSKHKQNDPGRYSLQMPTKDQENFADSEDLAKERLITTRKKALYQQFMEEYLELDLMENILKGKVKEGIVEIMT